MKQLRLEFGKHVALVDMLDCRMFDMSRERFWIPKIDVVAGDCRVDPRKEDAVLVRFVGRKIVGNDATGGSKHGVDVSAPPIDRLDSFGRFLNGVLVLQHGFLTDADCELSLGIDAGRDGRRPGHDR